jgi:hypothetical protein
MNVLPTHPCGCLQLAASIYMLEGASVIASFEVQCLRNLCCHHMAFSTCKAIACEAALPMNKPNGCS